MGSSPSPGVTRLLQDVTDGNRAAVDRLLPIVYDELRRLAGGYMRFERAGETLQATALVHEAYLKLIDQHSVTWQNRAHFVGVAARLMRYILLDRAKSRGAEKRGGHALHTILDEALVVSAERSGELVALDEALSLLENLDAQQARIVELRFFGGLTVEETAEVLSISPATVKREWAMAKVWLYDQLRSDRREDTS